MSKAPEADDLRAEMIAMVPSLRAFAISLSNNRERADDLVQDTIVRALTSLSTFQPGTNLQSWMFTILRNAFLSEYRKRKREVDDPDGSYALKVGVQPNQDAYLMYKELLVALSKLNADQREALLLVVASGFSYEEAAQIMGVALGTAKSRVIRARQRLSLFLSVESNTDLGADKLTVAALQG